MFHVMREYMGEFLVLLECTRDAVCILSNSRFEIFNLVLRRSDILFLYLIRSTLIFYNSLFAINWMFSRY